MDGEVTRILDAIGRGEPRASSELLPLVYDELRRLAEARVARERGATIQATELVHEAYLRLVGAQATAPSWDGRAHFFAAAAEAMRRILVDRARARGASKRGGDWRRVSADLGRIALDDVPPELVELDEALTKLRAVEPEKARLVELRFFGGLTMEQAAALLGISPATAARQWSFARAWLYDELS